jgi:hypothetical protein
VDATGQWSGRGLISTGLALELDLDLEFLTKIFVLEEEDPFVLLLFPFAILFLLDGGGRTNIIGSARQ